MPQPSPHEVSQLLRAWSSGDEAALQRLIPLVYEELHRIARRYMGRERKGHTLQTSALVNEAYLRLVDWKNVDWQNRAHFFAVSAQMMRRILVDFARNRHYLKRGGGALQVSLAEADGIPSGRGTDLLALNEALNSLAAVDQRKSRMVELRFFGLYPLAHLGLARAAALKGDVAGSRKAYQDFLALWKDADADLPILMAAKKEYEKVR